MANKKSKTHTGQAGVVGCKSAKIKEVNESIREYGISEYGVKIEVSKSKKNVLKIIDDIKKDKWSTIEQEFQDWISDPIDGSKCTYTSAQRLELIKFFKSKFLK